MNALLPLALALAVPAWTEPDLPALQLETPDHHHKLRLHLLTQLRAESALDDVTADPTARRMDHELSAHHIWAGATAVLFDRHALMHLKLNLTPGKLELLDFWGAGLVQTPFDLELELKGGLFVIPLTWYRTIGWRNTMGSDWSLITQALGAERQWGLEGEARYGDHLDARAGVFTGVNNRRSHAVALARDVYRTETPLRSDLLAPVWPEELHPEVVGMVGYTLGQPPAALSDRELARGARFALSAAWDARPALDEPGLRIAPEVLVAGHGLTGHAIAFATTGGDELAYTVATVGGLMGLAWRVWGPLELATTAGALAYTDDVRRDAERHARARIAAAATDERAALVRTLSDAGAVRGRGEATVGATLWLWTHGRLQLEGAWLPVVTDDGVRHPLRARAQIEMTF